MNQTIKELMERKSVRVYEERPIEPEKKALIIEAALQALGKSPNASARRPWCLKIPTAISLPGNLRTSCKKAGTGK